MSAKGFNIMSSSNGVIVFILKKISKRLPDSVVVRGCNIILIYKKNSRVIGEISIPATEHMHILSLNNKLNFMVAITHDGENIESKMYNPIYT